MKKLYLLSLIFAFVISGCVPKSQEFHLAMDTLERVEKVCDEIESDVDKLNDEYTMGVFENIKKSAGNYRALLSDSPSRNEVESLLTPLSRLEKELGSIKMLAGGMEDYTPELTFNFTNDTGKAIEKIVIKSESEGEIEAFSGTLEAGSSVAIPYPVDVGIWSITAYMSGGDEVTGEEIKLSSINVLKLSFADGAYAYTTE